MHEKWDITLGSLWRTFKVRGRKAGPFVKKGSLTTTDSGLEVTVQYDPPGSGWMAFGATMVTGIIVFAIAQATGSCAGPGWLLWFIGIALLRRRTVTLNVQDAEMAIIDPANRRLAFLTTFEGKQRWIAVNLVGPDFEGAAQAVAMQFQGRVFQDKIDRALTSGSIGLIVFGSVLVVMILLSVIAAFVFFATSRRAPTGMIGTFKTYAASIAFAINFLPGPFRRSRCTAE